MREERERDTRSHTHFLMGSDLLHKKNDFVDALMSWSGHNALAISTKELTMGKKYKRSCMMRPYLWDSAWMDQWGSRYTLDKCFENG